MENLQSSVPVNICHEDIDTLTDLQNKSSNYNVLEYNITTFKVDMITLKNFMMQDIFKITQRIKKVEKMNCRVEVK